MASRDSGSAAAERLIEHDPEPFAPAEIPAPIRDHLGQELRALYAAVLAEEQPRRLLDLIARLEQALSEQDDTAASAFRADLLAALPGLRAFAHSLTANAAQADDLVQEAVLKAWANRHRFAPGSNFMAWLCTILRNQFYTECRKRRREVEDAEGAMAAQLTAPAAQEHGVELRKVWALLAKLPPLQREALLLVGAQGLTYEAAADLVGCRVGTVKSRVSRARAYLAGSLNTPLAGLSA
ncbi:sigma-70 family RNA polymerase sigma factor [Methylobacterium nigriterrae]|uniref:sigma-70 family RNA polymerase sigma factor n=1 Tax=Methylobacterium nigriterrae TaxID=3127512 RepID=UPI003013A980